MMLHCALCTRWKPIKGRLLCGTCHEYARRRGLLSAFPYAKWFTDTRLLFDEAGEAYYRKKTAAALYAMERRRRLKTDKVRCVLCRHRRQSNGRGLCRACHKAAADNGTLATFPRARRGASKRGGKLKAKSRKLKGER